MRGLATVLGGRELAPDEVSTVLVVCSSDIEHCPQILAQIWNRFPEARFTYIVPEGYVRFLPEGADVELISELKKDSIRKLREIRARKFDATVLMLTGQPIFRKTKLWALLTNCQMLVIYNECLDSFSCGSASRMMLFRHLKRRLEQKGFPSLRTGVPAILLRPLGLTYLIFFTGWVLLRRRAYPSENLRNKG